MNNKIFIGIDNGVTGSLAAVDAHGNLLGWFKTPVERRLDYTKTKSYLNRLVPEEFKRILHLFMNGADSATVLLERPMVNAKRWTASVSAIRCDESERIVLELLELPYMYVDSKEWQRDMLPGLTPIPRLPKGASAADKAKAKKARAKRKKELKTVSLEIGKRLFPSMDFDNDADSALMAEWARRKNL